MWAWPKAAGRDGRKEGVSSNVGVWGPARGEAWLLYFVFFQLNKSVWFSTQLR